MERIIPEVMDAKPDFIIMISHLGRFGPPGSNIGDLALKYPQIGLFLGGHTHTEDAGTRSGPASWFAQAGKHGECVLKAEIQIDPQNRRADTLSTKIIPVDAGVPESPLCLNAAEKWLNIERQESKKVIGSAKTPIFSKSPEDFCSPMNELGGMAIAAKSGAKIAFFGGGSGKIEGPVTKKDVYNIFPFEDYICTLDLSARDVKALIREQIKNMRIDRFQSPWNVMAELGPSGEVKGKLKFGDGTVWEDESARVKAAFNGYSLASAGSRSPVLRALASNPDCKRKDTDFKMRASIEDYIQKNSPLDFTPREWVKGAPSK